MKLKVTFALAFLALIAFSFTSASAAPWKMDEAVVYCPGIGYGIECVIGNTACLEEFDCW